ncbi:MAG: methylated-DNA--[protein]-cysteine S-methyltransferase [Sphingomonas sp.]|nr:methylated-DNA--[protein]-cysteine S-methyltransferase [Sphingomonas sp.]
MGSAVNHYHLFQTAHGFAALAWNERGVTSFRLPAPSAEETRRALLRRLPDAIETEPSADMAGLIQAITRYFEGERSDFAHVPLDLGRQDSLFAKIYDLVRRLGWGETTTYGEIARALGEGPEVARDVGQAMARNPIPLIVPCHRVLAAGGRIGGFSAPGGSNAKARMLELEGVAPEPAAPAKSSAQASFGF